jgi:RNA polymerase sigma-70 factor, ECF subfamily
VPPSAADDRRRLARATALRPVLAARGLGVHGVYPAGIDTDMLAGIDLPTAARPRAAADRSSGKHGRPADRFGRPMSLSAPHDTATPEELELVAAIRGGDEVAFATAVERHYRAMLAVAKAYVSAPDAAKRVVHDAWMAALGESDRFDGSAPLRVWLLRLVVRRAAPLAEQPDGAGRDASNPAVDPDRFRDRAEAFPGHWRAYPRDWRTLAEDVRRGDRVRRVVEAAVGSLPAEQRAVITLRDIVGCSARETCDVLELADTVALERLHRARCRVRGALERHFDD